MTIIEDNSISLTRGDSLRTTVGIMNGDGTTYNPESGDVIKFGLKRTVYDPECIVEKTIPIDTMELYLAPTDTKNLPFGDYVYDLQIIFANGDVCTFIACAKFKITGEVV